MILTPAVDLREGAAVQLVGGDYAREAIRLADPVAVAQSWVRAGFQTLHLVDLDAATGRGDNRRIVADILALPDVTVQVGGGVRGTATLEGLLSLGADRVVVGTRAVEDPEWLAVLACRYPGRLVVAADVWGRRVLTRGWSAASGEDVADFFSYLDPLPLGAVLVTVVQREGLLGGTDVPLLTELAQHSGHDIIASGGISTVDEIVCLEESGVAGAVLGMALYSGVLEPGTVAEEWKKTWR